jgi:hypothetical protein
VLIDPSVHVPTPVDDGPVDEGPADAGPAPADEPPQEPPAVPGTDPQTHDDPAPRRPEPVPYVDAADSSPFEIDEVEALPEPSPGSGHAG